MRGKHPHGCGEDVAPSACPAGCRETPPRVWGRRPSTRVRASIARNTPTGVGKTVSPLYQRLYQRKHPHGCGEDTEPHLEPTLKAETPPRVWGRLLEALERRWPRGNTPTGVGKTHVVLSPFSFGRKHPHGCGEDLLKDLNLLKPEETPPRVWGRLWRIRSVKRTNRNTPTGVGKTNAGGGQKMKNGKHPHGCGEDQRVMLTHETRTETPPRVWGRREEEHHGNLQRRNTPTGVGKTKNVEKNQLFF